MALAVDSFSQPRANPGSLSIRALPDVRFIDYEALLPQYDGTLNVELHREMARQIDSMLTPTTVAVIMSIRRWYKMTDMIPTNSQAIYSELDMIYNRQSAAQIADEDVTHALGTIDKIVEILLPYSDEWADWCSRALHLTNLHEDDVYQIARATTFKNVVFRLGYDRPDSNGAALIKLMSSSIKRMVLAYETHANVSEDAGNLTLTDIISSDYDYESREDALTYDSGQSALSAEDQFLLNEENEQRWADEADEPLAEGEIEIEKQRIADVKVSLRDYSIEQIFSAIASLPIYKQTKLLYYFGYIGQGVRQAEFGRLMKMYLFVDHTNLEELLSRIPNQEDVYPVDTWSMFALATNSEEIERSKIENNPSGSSLFNLLHLLGETSVSHIETTKEVKDILLTVRGNIERGNDGLILDHYRPVADALSGLLGRPVDTNLARRIIKEICIPAVSGGEPNMQLLYKKEKSTVTPSELIGAWMNELSKQGKSIGVYRDSITQNEQKSENHMRFLQVLWDHPDDSLVKIGEKLGMSKQLVDINMRRIVKNIIQRFYKDRVEPYIAQIDQGIVIPDLQFHIQELSEYFGGIIPYGMAEDILHDASILNILQYSKFPPAQYEPVEGDRVFTQYELLMEWMQKQSDRGTQGDYSRLRVDRIIEFLYQHPDLTMEDAAKELFIQTREIEKIIHRATHTLADDLNRLYWWKNK